jgi:hypothetical protein
MTLFLAGVLWLLMQSPAPSPSFPPGGRKSTPLIFGSTDERPQSPPSDAAFIAAFRTTASRVEKRRAIVWFEAGAMAALEQEYWAGLISDGIDNIERYLGVSVGPNPLEYYVASYVGDGSSYKRLPTPHVFLPLSRIQQGTAPYLHEAVHHAEFLNAPDRPSWQPTWLIEGFANYVEDAVAESLGGVPGHVFTRGGNPGVDAEAREWLAARGGAESVPFVGRAGLPPNFGDRENVMRPFYVLSQSFTKYLVEAVGLKSFTTRLLPSFFDRQRFEQEVATMTGRSLEDCRTAWLVKIGASSLR